MPRQAVTSTCPAKVEAPVNRGEVVVVATVITYKRGDRYVENKSGAEIAHGLVGEMWVHGYCFDAIERMDGYVCLDGGRSYHNSIMYWHKRLKCYVVNPWHHKLNNQKKKAEILVHRATVPSHLEGCMAPGFLEGQRLTLSTESMAVIWEQCGGKPGMKSVVVTFRVEGDMKPLSSCKAHGA